MQAHGVTNGASEAIQIFSQIACVFAPQFGLTFLHVLLTDGHNPCSFNDTASLRKAHVAEGGSSA